MTSMPAVQPSSEERTSVGCAFVALLAFLIGAALSSVTIRDAWEEWRISRYVPVDCTITSAALDVSSTRETNRDSGRERTSTRLLYTPRVSYSYEIDGTRRQGNRFASRNYLRGLDGGTAKEQIGWLNSTKRATCFRSPSDPDESVVRNDRGDARRYLVLIPTLLMTLAGALFFGVAVHEYGSRRFLAISRSVASSLYRSAPPRWRWIVNLTVAALIATLILVIYVHSCS